MLVDHAGALRWASASDQVAEPVAAGQERLAQGPCMLAFAQRAPAAVRDISAEPGWRELAQVCIDEGIHAALSVPVQVGGGPVGTLDIYVAAPREWDDSEAAALQAHAGLVASLLVAAVTAQVKGRLADQLQAALEHRLLIEQAEEVLIDREGMNAQAAFQWLWTAARSSEREVVEVAREVVGGAALPSDRLAQAKARRHKDTDREVAVHRRDSELHEGAAQRYERRGEPIPGFDLSNSPLEFRTAQVRGKTVFFTTSNGTRALLAARAAAAIGVAALVNVTAAAAWAAGGGRDVAILCAGSRGARSLEDWACAGLAVDRILATVPTALLTEAARDALDTGRRYVTDVGRLKRDAPWARRLIAAGRSADVDACLRLDTTSLVPRYVPHVDKIVGDHP